MDVAPQIAPHDLAAALRGLAQSRDVRCWEALVAQAGGEIFDFSRRIVHDENLADDVTQETLLRVRDCAKQFKPDGQIDANTSARRWIMRIACTSALQLLRARKRGQLRDTAYALATTAETGNPADTHVAAETAARVRQEVEALPERERLPILFHYYAEMPYEQIAEQLDCPVGTAKTNVHRGLEKLRTRLTALGVVAPASAAWLEPALRAPVSAPATALQLAKWKALLTAPKAAALASATTGGLSLMAKLCIGSAAAVLATAAAVIIPRAFSASTPPAPAATPTPAVVAPEVAAIPAAPQWQADLREQLQRRGKFNFFDEPLVDAVDFLKSISKAKIQFSPAARKKAEDEKKKLTLRVKSMPFERSLQLIAYLSDLEFKYADGAAILDVANGVPQRPHFALTNDGAAVALRLKRQVTFEFVDTHAEEGIEFFGEVADITYVLSSKASPKSVDLLVWNMSLENALFWTTVKAHLAMQWEDDVIFLDPIEPDPASGDLAQKLDTRVTDTLTGMPADKALELICHTAGVKYTLTPEAAPLIAGKTIADTVVPSGSLTAGVLLELIASSQGLDVKVAGNELKLQPHVPARNEGELQQSLNSGLKVNLIALPGKSGAASLVLPENLIFTAALQKTITDAGLIHKFRNGAIGIGAPVDVWKLEELPAAAPAPAAKTEQADQKSEF